MITMVQEDFKFGPTVLNEIDSFLKEQKRLDSLGQCSIRVSVQCKPYKHDRSLWLNNKYSFDFGNAIFTYDDNEIKLTEHEQQVLKDYLIHGTESSDFKDVLCSLRYQYGEDFLPC